MPKGSRKLKLEARPGRGITRLRHLVVAREARQLYA
jgi:hypothetical protein